jgi:Cu2+-exporting ATPase
MSAIKSTSTACAVPPGCAHCGLPLPPGAERFCCSGCAAVWQLLHEEELERYYDLRQGAAAPVGALRDERADRKWLEPIETQLATAPAGARTTVRLDVQGVRCAACVWLLDALFRRSCAGGANMIVINPALGTATLTIGNDFPLRRWVIDVERFGYVLGPSRRAEGAGQGTSSLLWRLGISAALSMNAMIFAVAIYAGLESGPLRRLFDAMVFAMAAAAVAVGGSVFITSAALGLRRRVLHMDVPIALGIVLAFASSTVAYALGRTSALYFDTLCVFITLMLLGRFLQERVLERNRRQILAADGAEALLTRRRAGEQVELVACGALRAGDELIIAAGDLVPVDAELMGDGADCSLDWVSGEAEPRRFERGATVPAGAFNAGQAALRMRARTDFAQSPLTELIRATTWRDADLARATPWWRRFAQAYVSVVLVVGAATFAGWWILGGDPVRALEVTAAVLIVTCPCAFGIATPLAYELTQAGLRRAGLFVRTGGFLDRAADVRRVVFDKTGTLTTGALRLADETPLTPLDDEAAAALYDLAARSTHPKAAAVARALERLGRARLDDAARTHEVAGRGVELARAGALYRLGAPGWAAPVAVGDHGAADLVFGKDGHALAELRCREELRPDAAYELAELARAGHELWILSGDAPERTARLAAAVGVAPERAIGGLDPRAKAEWLAAHDRADTLMIGDGINDAAAVERATCSGTPAVDRPFMPARSDFYFTSPGLRPVRLALAAARALHRVTRRNLVIAVAYNAVTVTLAVAGLMSPLAVAVVMPISSLSVVLSSTWSLSQRSRVWTSSSCRSS